MATSNEKNFELKIGKTGLIIIISVMAGFLCAAFLFGVDVGKNIDTYPGQIAALPQRALALVWRPAKIKIAQNAQGNNIEQNQQTMVLDSPAAPTGENIDLTYHNALTSKKGFPKEEASLDKERLTSQAQNVEETEKGKFHIETPKLPVTANGKTNEKEVPNEKKSPLDNVSNKNKYIVQAASLKEKDKAKQVNKKIADLGFKSEIVKIDIKGKGIVYRVIATGFNDKVEAEKAAQKISSKTATKCIIKSTDNNISKN